MMTGTNVWETGVGWFVVGQLIVTNIVIMLMFARYLVCGC